MARAFIIVLDSCGCGELPDADKFGDVGANTLKRISKSNLNQNLYLKEYRKIIKTLKMDMLALSGSLIATFVNGGITSIGAVASLLKSISDTGKYYTNVHEHNGYFLWKLEDKAKKYQI